MTFLEFTRIYKIKSNDFKFNRIQLELINNLENDESLVFDYSRQEGITTILAYYIAYKMYENDNCNILLLGNRKQNYHLLSYLEQIPLRWIKKSTLSLNYILNNSSLKLLTTHNSMSLRGYNIDLIVADHYNNDKLMDELTDIYKSPKTKYVINLNAGYK